MYEEQRYKSREKMSSCRNLDEKQLCFSVKRITILPSYLLYNVCNSRVKNEDQL
jgi:hypothetical protein